MEDIINIITNNGIGVAAVFYLIYFQNTTMKQMLKTMKNIDKRLTRIEAKNGIVDSDSNDDEDDEE